MKPSPARALSPEPESWIPLDSLESLPELEDLLSCDLLVESGQTRAVRVGQDGTGYIANPKSKQHIDSSEFSKAQSRRKRLSKHRTLKLKRRAKYQRIASATLAIIVIASAVAFYLNQGPSNSAVAASSLTAVPKSVPIYVPVVIEGERQMRLSVAQDLESFVNEQGLEDLAAVSNYFSRTNYTTKRSAPAMEFNYVKELKIDVDGEIQEVRVSGLTIENVLAERGIVVKGNDIVKPAMDSKAFGVKTISIQRVTTKTRTEERIIPFVTQRQNDSALAEGQTKQVQRGVNGKEEVTITQTISDGEVVEEKVTDSKELVAPKPRIIKVGTKSTSSTNSSAPASSNSSTGSESGVASYYAAPGGTCAHKTLPFGTIITVTNTNNGKTTTCRVADRGPFIAGRVIDLSEDRFSAIASLSSGITSVRLSW